jgi:predicted ATPase
VTPLVQVESISFSDGQEIPIEPRGITILVGPNNSGKTSTLREIDSAFQLGKCGPVLTDVTIQKKGDVETLEKWLDANVVLEKRSYPRDDAYSWLGADCHKSQLRTYWGGKGLGSLAGILTTMLAVEERLQVTQPQEIIDRLVDAPKHPMHALYVNDDLESKVNNCLQKAFGIGLTLNRGAGKKPALHFGAAPKPAPGEDRVSSGYVNRLMDLPLLHEQGHGIRSFAGCVIHSLASHAFVHLIDEPEVFLYPAQARLLGGLLAKLKPDSRQLIIATHSGDFLRGMIDSKGVSLKVIRLTRDGSINRARQLDVSQITQLWSDPILRFSNVLDGVYHDTVVVCESDSDCRFYSAVTESICERDQRTRPDVLFAASGGKDRMPVVISSLVSLGVRTKVVADFDVLREQHPLEGIVLALGGDWNDIQGDWSRVKKAVEQKNLRLNALQVKGRVNKVLDKEGGALTDATIDEIKKILRTSTQWEQAKLAGVDAVYSGQPRATLNLLLERLRRMGLHVVECGEIERFAPSMGGHGPKWVSEVLKKDLMSDPEMEDARRFIQSIFGICAIQPVAPAVQESASQAERVETQDWPTRTFSTTYKMTTVKQSNVTEHGFWFHLCAAFRSLWKRSPPKPPVDLSKGSKGQR